MGENTQSTNADDSYFNEQKRVATGVTDGTSGLKYSPVFPYEAQPEEELGFISKQQFDMALAKANVELIQRVNALLEAMNKLERQPLTHEKIIKTFVAAGYGAIQSADAIRITRAIEAAQGDKE